MVVVGDRHPDVVQHRRRPQQLALAGLGLEQRAAWRASRASAATSIATCSTCAMSDSYWIARLRTAASRTSSNSGSGRLRAASARGTRRRAGPPRSPRARRTRPSSTTVSSTTAAARMMSPRSGLIPGTVPRSARRHRREPLDELGHRLGRDHEPLDAEVDRPVGRLRGGGEVADRAADPDQARARRRAASRARRAPRARGRGGAARSFLRAGPSSGQELLGHPHGAERERRQLVRAPVGDVDELHAAAAELEHDPVGQRRGVDRGDVAVPGLVLGRQDLDRRGRSARVRARGTRRGSTRRGSRSWRSRARRRRASPLATQKRSNTASVSSPRSIASSAEPAGAPRARRRSGPSHTARRSASTTRGPPASYVNTTSRHEFEPRSITATCRFPSSVRPGCARRSPAHGCIIAPGADGSRVIGPAVCEKI